MELAGALFGVCWAAIMSVAVIDWAFGMIRGVIRDTAEY